MEFKYYNRKSLAEFVYSKEYEALKDLPISRHRAISQSLNPRADEDDVLLIVAYKEGIVAGYLGLLADELFFKDGSSTKAAWFSCIWVGPAGRGQGLADEMIKRALEAWQNRNLITEIVPAITKIYDRTGAFETMSLSGLRLYIRMDLHTILPPKKKLFQQLKGLIKVGDNIVNFFMDMRFAFASAHLKDIKLQYINEIDEETESFIASFHDKLLFKRGKEELNWIIKNPWLLTSPTDDEFSKRYYFSSFDREFGFYCIKVRNAKDELIAFIILSQRNRILKMPYCFCEAEVVPQVVKVIEKHILELKINTFTTYHPLLTSHFANHGSVGFYKKQVKREYYLSKLFAEKVKTGDYLIQDGDGIVRLPEA